MSEQLERAVLGSIIADPKSLCEILGASVDVSCFKNPKRQAIFSAALKAEKESGVSANDISAMLDPDAALEFATCLQEGSTIPGYHAKELHAHARRQRLARELSFLANRLLTAEPFAETNEQIYKDATALLEESTRGAESKFNTRFENQALADTLAGLEARIVSFRNGKPPGIPTGFRILDQVTQGFAPGRLYIVAARTSVGKTTLAANFFTTAAKASFAPVFFTIEMQNHEITEKILSMDSDVYGSRFLMGDMDDGHINSVHDSAKRLAEKRWTVCDRFGGTIGGLEQELKRLKRLDRCSLAIVDYLQLLDADGHYPNRHSELAKISKRLKELSKELSIPIIALAQLNREADQRELPKLSHLKDSGSIEQDADVVFMLHRMVDGENEKTYGIIAKNRLGKIGNFELQSNLALSKFWQLEKEELSKSDPKQMVRVRKNETMAASHSHNTRTVRDWNP